MEKEIWKDIKGYYGRYQISSWGRVKSLNYKNTGKEKILLTPIDMYGYPSVCLYDTQTKKAKRVRVHRLVAEAFIPNPYNKECINHKDEDKTNNCVSNLEFCDRLYNNNYGTRNDRMADTKKNGSQSKSVLQKDIETDEVIAEFPSLNEVQRQLGFNESSISQCCNGKFKSAYGYKWSFK